MLCLSGNSPCLNGGACTDGIGSYTCACAARFCGPTCADPEQNGANGPQCPCVDDPAWVDQYGRMCSYYGSHQSYCSQQCDEESWPDKDHGLICGECKVLVNHFMTTYAGSCNNYCRARGRLCTAMWEESGDTST